MRRRFSYALTAGVLSSGAPAGLLGIRLARGDDDEVSLRRVRSEIAADRAAYMYVGGATAVIFALFGYILGRHADELSELSETDALTDLLNARGFAARLHAETRRSKRYREPLSLLVPRSRRPEENQRSPWSPGRQRRPASSRPPDSRGAARNRHRRALGRRRVHHHRAEHTIEPRRSRLRSGFVRASRATKQTGR